MRTRAKIPILRAGGIASCLGRISLSNRGPRTLILAVVSIATILSFAAAAVTILEHGTAMALSPHVLSAALG